MRSASLRSNKDQTITRMMTWLNRIIASMIICATLGTFVAHAEDGQSLLDRLTKAGVTPSVLYDGDAAANMSGGVKQGAAYSGTLHLRLALDGDHLAGLTGWSGWLDALWIHGTQPGVFTGDVQGVSNIAASPALRIYEAWIQYNRPDNRFSVLAGRYDLNTEFYQLRSAALFLNSSFGIGPEFGQSGVAGPSIFPNTSLGVRFAYKPSPVTLVRFAVLDGAPLDQQNGSPGGFDHRNGLLLIAEAALLTRPAASDERFAPRYRIGRGTSPPTYEGKAAIGVWYYTGTFDEFVAANPAATPARHQGEGGAYFLLDRALWQASDDPKRRITWFVQLGVADPRVDRFGAYAGAGITAFGVVPSRPADEFGLAVAMARNGAQYIAGQQQAGLSATAAETAIELSYLSQIAPWLAVQPDVQYVIHPNTDPRLRNAIVAQLRVELKF